jgi:hypothetical protein
MPDFFDYDPDNNVTQEFEYDEATGDVRIHYSSDIEAVLDYNKRVQNTGLNDKGIKQNWWLYAKIPPIWQLKLRARGFKLDSSDDTARLLAEINSNAPALKCTQLNHGGKLATVHDLGSAAGHVSQTISKAR